ncbi:enoyl-CoA hydratase-related protein [Actibacterium sp. D379-3]
MTDQIVKTERDGNVAILTLNDPARRNVLSDEMVDGVVAALQQADNDPQVYCAVLTGAGPDFCSGGNIKDMLNGTNPMFTGTPAEMQASYRRNIQRLPKAFHAVDMPIVAAVNGNAIGAGCDLACMCDIRISTTGTRFSEGFSRVGLISGDGGAWYLPRVVGVSRAMEMALTCDVVDPERAVQWGLVSRVVAPEALLAEALAVAGRVASFSRLGSRLNKRLIRQSAELSLADSLELAAAYQSIIQHTHDQGEAVAALIEKRPPHFTGS